MSKAGEVAAAVGIGLGVTIATVGVIAAAVVCPEAFTPPPRRVVVTKRGAPTRGVPAFGVQSGQPYVIHTHGETVILPQGYAYEYVVYNGRHCNIVRQQNGQCYYICDGRHYAVVFK